MTNLVVSSKLGCISRGWEWQIPRDYFGFPVPQDIATNLSRVAVTSAVGTSSPLLSSCYTLPPPASHISLCPKNSLTPKRKKRNLRKEKKWRRGKGKKRENERREKIS
jgi:hypothetical protein